MNMRTNVIYNTDCLKAMKNMPDGSIKAVVTSPPYNINIGGMGKPKKKNRLANTKFLFEKYATHNDQMPRDEYVCWMRDILAELMRLISDDGVIFWNHKNPVKDGLLIDNSEIVRGFPVRQHIIWARPGAYAFQKTYFGPSHEIIYMICKPKFRVVNDMHKMLDVWKINRSRNNPHPAPFPVEIPMRCIQASVAEGDKESVVLDPFMGSGTTAIAAMELGVNWIGIEKSEEYARMARNRVRREKEQGKLSL